MSHLKQREETNCLNCNAEVNGRFCSVCGQENIVPNETAWHLITHFFNDITHFDSKFFTTLKILFTQPGFLAEEYRIGRRISYLNPVRLYVFSSFFFFLVIFSLEGGKSKEEDGLDVTRKFNGKTIEQIDKMDSAEFKAFTIALTKGKELTRQQFKIYTDTVSSTGMFSVNKYKSKAEYDSLYKAGKVNDSWIERMATRKMIELDQKSRKTHESPFKDIGEKFVHRFPQMLFISLPLFAFFLLLLYKRHPRFTFVSHGIFTIYLYVFCFMMILLLTLVEYLTDLTKWGWLGVLQFFLWVGIFVYEYKAMRKFYGQGKGKTLLKMFLLNSWLLFISIVLFSVFSIIIFFKL